MVVGIECRIIIGLVACDTGVRSIVVIAIVTIYTPNSSMSAIQRPVVVVYGEGSRFPACICSMAHGTIGRNRQCYVVGVKAGIEIRRMTTLASIRGVGVIALVTGIAVVCDGYVCTCERINGIVVKGGRYPGRFIMANGTVGRKLSCFVIRIGGCVVIGLVATRTGIGGIVVIPVMAHGTVVGNSGMGAI